MEKYKNDIISPMVPITTYTNKKPTIDKVLEKIPGITTWLLITSPIWASLLFPTLFGTLILCYIILWLLKSLRNLIFFAYSFYKIKKAEKINWDKLKIRDKFITEDARTKLNHIIIIPFVKEGYSVLAPILNSLKNQTFNTKQIHVCLTYEKRYIEGKELAFRLKKEYEEYFGNIWINEHELKVGEIVGKGSNCYSASKYIESQIASKSNWDLDYVTLLASDCDSIFPKYFYSYLSYEYLSDTNRQYIFWAGCMAYMQNFWDIPHFSRVLNSAFSFYNISTIARSQTKFIQISTFVGSWRLLKSINFYEAGIVSDDFHSFFVALFKYHDKVRCQTLFCIIDSDACEGSSWRDNFKRQFKQVERWAWGIEDFVYLNKSMYHTLKRRDITLKAKIYVFMRINSVILDHLAWPVNGVIFALGSWIILLYTRVNEYSIFWANTSSILSVIFFIGSFSGIVAIVVSFILRPPHPIYSKRPWDINKIVFYISDFIIEMLHWFAFPVFSFLLSGVPAIIAHTRLMLGKYIGFVLTEKK